MKKQVILGLIQTAVSEDVKSNIQHTCTLIRSAAKRGAQIICLQELFAAPYFPQEEKVDAGVYAETAEGETVTVLRKLSKELGVVIIVPFYERDEKGTLYNSVVVVDEKGSLLPTYRKIHIPHDPLFWEKNYFAPGDRGYQVYDTTFGRFSVLICYDQWFPEAARSAALQGAEILFYPTAIGTINNKEQIDGDWHDSWETIQRSHAIANGVAVAAVNRVGTEDRLKFWGQSFACDAFGTVLARGSEGEEEVIVATVDLSLNTHVREGWGFLRNRRPETYSQLTHPICNKTGACK